MTGRPAILITAVGIIGCTTLQEIAALRTVQFALDRVSDARIAGVSIESGRSYTTLSAADVARLAAAVTRREVPLDMVLHISAENPAEPRVAARLIDLDWTFFVEDRETVSGKLAGTYLLPPGETVDVPIAVRLDLVDFFRGGARDLFETALAISGYGSAKEIRLEARPTVQTSLGPIRYPGPITIRRAVGRR